MGILKDLYRIVFDLNEYIEGEKIYESLKK